MAKSEPALEKSPSERVSVAIATYNGGKFLADQLESILTQSRRPDEIVVSDDCSSDNTLDVLNGYRLNSDIPIRIKINDTQLGFSKNFEQAIKMASGDVIFLSDQDDRWFEDKISIMLEIMRRSHADVAVCDSIIALDDLTPTGNSQLEIFRWAGYPIKDHCAGSCTALRSRLIPLLFPIPHDTFSYDVWISSVARALGLHTVLQVPLQLYRRHYSNVSQWQLSDPQSIRSGQIRKRIELSQDPQTGWRNMIKMRAVLVERLRANLPLLRKLQLDGAAQSAIARTNAEIRAIERRLQLLQLRKTDRLGPILRMLVSGDYRTFDGIKSALKDLLRPVHR